MEKQYYSTIFNSLLKNAKSRSARAHNQSALQTRLENLSLMKLRVHFSGVISVVHHFISSLNESEWGR